MDTYTARVTRDEDAWSVEVPEVHRTTQALTRRQVEPMARDLVAIMNDVAPDSFDLRIEWPTESPAPGAPEPDPFELGSSSKFPTGHP